MGRPLRKLQADVSASDTLFASQRIDRAIIQGQVFKHCTFANISFKDCCIKDAIFVNCVFASCYFRKAQLESVKFSGCKFVDCDLGKIDVRVCDFKLYNSFSGCFIRFDEIRDSLPSEGNLKSHLCFNLAREARNLGAIRESDRFRQVAAEGLESHLLQAVRHASSFYREKYTGGARTSAFGEYLASKSRGYLFGYKRSWLVLLRNWIIANVIIFPLWFLLVRAGIQRDGRPVAVGDLWLGSLGNTLPGSGISDVKFVSAAAQFAAFIEVLSALLFGGLVAALIFRSVFERSQ
jgi:hypothetical protein